MAGTQRETPMKTKGKRKPHIAVLDADPATLEYIHGILADRFSVDLFTQTAELNRSLSESPAPDLLLMDWHITEDETEENALGLLAKIHASKPTLPILMLACSAELKEVVEASRLGAVDVILKPFTKSDIDLAVQQCIQEADEPAMGDEITEIRLDENVSFVRCSKRMREIESQCTLVARADIPVLILGESGTGK